MALFSYFALRMVGFSLFLLSGWWVLVSFLLKTGEIASFLLPRVGFSLLFSSLGWVLVSLSHPEGERIASLSHPEGGD